MRHDPIKLYEQDAHNPYCFFQPKESHSNMIINEIKQLDELPTPMAKHRVPTSRLVPRGYY